jgi:hypothetical protein
LRGNIWIYLHYAWSPIDVYAAPEQRLVQMNYVRTALPSVALTFLLPILVIISNPEAPLANDLLSWWSWVLVHLTLFHHLLAALVEDTTKLDRLYSVKAELHFIRRA